MSKPLTIKDHQGESLLFKKRSLITLVSVLIFASLLILRLIYLQVIAHTVYSTLSRQNILAILPIEPNRGLIYDRNGILIAKNIPVFNLDIIPERTEHLGKLIQALKKIIPISDSDLQNFQRSLTQHRYYDAVPLKINLNENELAAFYVNHYRFPSVIVKTQMLRYYPLGNQLSDVLGYVGRINSKEINSVNRVNYSASNYIGKVGIEKYYEHLLHGTVGVQKVEINANGSVVRNIKRNRPTPGNNLYLTIDSRLQAYAEKALGNNRGAIVAIQPSTGQILALVTTPSFDPNLLLKGISRHEYEKLVHSPDHPLFNRTIRGQYAPGSTIKPFIAIAGLENQVITTESKINDPGWFRLPKTKHIYHDWKHSGHGWVNITKAIIVSCDTFFYQLSAHLGIHAINSMLTHFGFGKNTQVDMPEELSGLVPSPDWKQQNSGNPWYTGDTVLTGIGQGFLLVTPLQLAEATAILAEHGARYQPHLLFKYETPDHTIKIVPTIEKPPITLLHPKTWDTLISAMQGVISSPYGTANGFGHKAHYLVAAKTGTAQVYGKQRDEEHIRMNIPKKLRNNHLFISFAPVNRPEIALAVVVEHAAWSDRIAREVMDFYFQHCAKQDASPNYERVLPT